MWDTRQKAARHVAEAKHRGLTCGVEVTDGQPEPTTLDALREQLVKANAELTAA